MENKLCLIINIRSTKMLPYFYAILLSIIILYNSVYIIVSHNMVKKKKRIREKKKRERVRDNFQNNFDSRGQCSSSVIHLGE